MTKTTLIAGSSSGLGRATAKHFHAKGWNVVATMRNPEREEELIRLDPVLVTRLDVQDLASIQAAVDAGISKFGRIDALMNNALERQHIYHELNVLQGLLQITRDKGIPFIDRMASSAAWVENIGRAQASAFYVDGDATRSNEEGARGLATLVVEGAGRKLRSSPCGSRVGPASRRMGAKEPAAVSSSPGHFG